MVLFCTVSRSGLLGSLSGCQVKVLHSVESKLFGPYCVVHVLGDARTRLFLQDIAKDFDTLTDYSSLLVVDYLSKPHCFAGSEQ